MEKVSAYWRVIAVGALAVCVALVIWTLNQEKDCKRKKTSCDCGSGRPQRAVSAVLHELSSPQEALDVINGGKGDTKAMIMVHRPGCPACTHAHPQYEKAARSLKGSGVKFYSYST